MAGFCVCTYLNYCFSEIKECFSKKEDGSPVTFALMGDSRVRNLYEYFQQMLQGNFTAWAEKPHRDLDASYPDFNFQVDFLWGPQTETGNQDVFEQIWISISSLVHLSAT